MTRSYEKAEQTAENLNRNDAEKNPPCPPLPVLLRGVREEAGLLRPGALRQPGPHRAERACAQLHHEQHLGPERGLPAAEPQLSFSADFFVMVRCGP